LFPKICRGAPDLFVLHLLRLVKGHAIEVDGFIKSFFRIVRISLLSALTLSGFTGHD
jgi:hypothetical protein